MQFGEHFAKVNLWKVSTLFLAAALAFVLSDGRVTSADAAGPKNLGKALASLKATKGFLEAAKEPPAPFHQQSMLLVTQSIAAVEREIKAYEDALAKAKAAGTPTTKPAGAATTKPAGAATAKPAAKPAEKPKAPAATGKKASPTNVDDLLRAI